MNGAIEESLVKLWAVRTDNFLALVRATGLDPSRDFVGADLRGMDFANLDLAGFDFTDADFRGADLTGADLRRAVITNALFSELTDEAEQVADPAEGLDVDLLLQQAMKSVQASERTRAIKRLAHCSLREDQITAFVLNRAVYERSYQAMDATVRGFRRKLKAREFQSILFSGLYKNPSNHGRRRLFEELHSTSKYSKTSYSEYVNFIISNPFPYFHLAMSRVKSGDADFHELLENASSYCKVTNDYKASRQILFAINNIPAARKYAVSAAEFIARNRILYLPEPPTSNFEFSLLVSGSFEILLYAEGSDPELVDLLGLEFFKTYRFASTNYVDATYFDRITSRRLGGAFANWILRLGEGAGYHHVIREVLNLTRDEAMMLAGYVIAARRNAARDGQQPNETIIEAAERSATTFKSRALVHRLSQKLADHLRS